MSTRLGVGFEDAEIDFIRGSYAQGYETFEFARRGDIPMNTTSGTIVFYHNDGRILYHEFARRSEEGKIITERIAEAFFANPSEYAIFKERLGITPFGGIAESSKFLDLTDKARVGLEQLAAAQKQRA